MEKRLVAMIALRVLVVTLALGLSLADRLPWWFGGVVLVREVMAGGYLLARGLRRRAVPDTDPLAPVAAIMLLVGLSLIGLSHGQAGAALVGRAFGWAAAWWGLALSWGIIVDRTLQLRRLLARDPDLGHRP